MHFDFESKLPNPHEAHSLGGGVGDLRRANVPNLDACMVSVEGDADPLGDHGFFDMKDFGRVTA